MIRSWFVVCFRYYADDKLRKQKFQSPLLAFRSISKKLKCGKCEIVSAMEEYEHE